jgi:hypothetical protein
VRDALRTTPDAVGEWRRPAFVACSWLLTFRSFTTPRSLFDCLVNSRCAASTRWRRSTRVLSGSQRNAIVWSTRAQVCYVLDSSAAALRERLSRRQ